jgi:hypothetical protein
MPSHSPTDVTTEIQVAGVYQSSYLGNNFRPREKDAVRITRGVQDQQGSVSPMVANFTLHNPSQLLTDDNPNSPLYGKVGLNTRCRLGIKKSGTWDEYLRLPDSDAFANNQYAYTADKASLDITLDIDIRVEFTPYYSRNSTVQMLISKFNTVGNQRSWALWLLDDGSLTFRYSTLGATTTDINTASYKIPEGSGRTAVRVTLDVDNGAGGKTFTIYSSDSINGTWTNVGTSTTGGTTSIFSSTAPLTIGASASGDGVFANHSCFRGKIHAAQVYNGIAGTLVADFAPAGKGIETTTWADACASPNTWILTGSNIRLASDRARFCGEILSLPDTWDSTGVDLYAPVTAYGLLNRYQSNKGPLRGAMYRRYRTLPSVTGYWPCEDENSATSIANALTNGAPGKFAFGTFAGTTGFDGSTGALTLTTQNTSYANFVIPQPTNTGQTTCIFYMKFDSLPAALTDFAEIHMPYLSTAYRWVISVSTTSYKFTGYAADGTVVATATTLHGSGTNPTTNWVGMELMISQEGANVRWETIWAAVGTNSYYTHFAGGNTYAGTMRQFDAVLFQATASEFAGVEIAHVLFANSLTPFNTAAYRDAGKAYAGEAFLQRAIRLAGEESLYFEWKGDPDNTEACGPQQAETLYNILAAGAKVDGGQLSDIRDRIGLLYVAGRYLGNRKGLSLSYSSNQPSELGQRVNDNRYTVNDFTASRTGGSSARYVADDDRKLNVREPDASSPGVGRYERGESFDASTDSQLPFLASRAVHFGTWPGRRVPSLALGMHRSQIFSSLTLFNDAIAMDIGDPVTVTGMNAAPTPPEDLFLASLGYAEVFNGFTWDITHNTVPAGQYWSPIFGDYFANREPRMDNAVSRVHGPQAGVSAVATTFKIRTQKKTAVGTDEPRWIDTAGYPAEFPVDLMLNGERMTLTAATAPTTDASLQVGTFETATDVNDWLPISCTFTSSTTFAQAGVRSGLMTVTGAPTTVRVLPLYPAHLVPVTPGDIVTLSLYVRSVALLADVHANLEWYSSAFVYVSANTSGAAALASGSWVQRTVTATVPAGATYMLYGPEIGSSPVAGTQLYVDSITVLNASVNYQTLTVTRSVNGISRAHAQGDLPYLFEQHFLGTG